MPSSRFRNNKGTHYSRCVRHQIRTLLKESEVAKSVTNDTHYSGHLSNSWPASLLDSFRINVINISYSPCGYKQLCWQQQFLKSKPLRDYPFPSGMPRRWKEIKHTSYYVSQQGSKSSHRQLGEKGKCQLKLSSCDISGTDVSTVLTLSYVVTLNISIPK